ncbi:hypothetical protein CTI12_AA306160 [Artemisia annua]|uniref:Uncharacterized protein n=1 Tax=Artemisia annua TaxID=35608 RepID=A0A2U1N582_ARTAN|nr:hypothetical protein CTI12_AA306160 [Artemisia annua]
MQGHENHQSIYQQLKNIDKQFSLSTSRMSQGLREQNEEIPSLSGMLHKSLLIHSKTFVSKHGRLQSYCGLKLTEVVGESTGPAYLRAARKTLERAAFASSAYFWKDTCSRPLKLWEENWHTLSEDILHKKRKFFKYPELELTDEKLQNYCFIEIQELLNRNGRSLSEFQDLPLPNPKLLTNLDNRLIREALDYDMKKTFNSHLPLLYEHTQLPSQPPLPVPSKLSQLSYSHYQIQPFCP